MTVLPALSRHREQLPAAGHRRPRRRQVQPLGYGGDEFIIMVPGITSLRAIQLADQLTRPPSHVIGHDGKPIPYSASIGIAEGLPGGDLSTLLMHADLAMYEAKQAGDGGWRIFGDAAGTEPRRADR